MRILLALVAMGALFPFCALAAETPTKPNIVVILADDMGYGDLKAYNPESNIATPNLDRMAAEGIVFTDAHSGGSTCKPSRYSLLTGRFNPRAPSYDDRAGPIIPEGESTIASLLRDHGYSTAMVGKWHLGFDQKAPTKAPDGFRFDYDQSLTGGPVDRGFESFFGMHASLDIPPYFFIRDRTPTEKPTDTVPASTSVGGKEGWNKIQGAFWREGPIAPDFKHGEVTPRFASEAIKVIEAHADSEKPLFLYVALPSPHTPWLPTKEFAGKSDAGMYGDFVMQVDSVVGQILGSLEKAGMKDDTLVIFSSDNGPVWYEKDTERFHHASRGPLRGIKASIWEGGHRVPFLVNWPGHVQAGSSSDRLVAFADLYGTFAELIGQEPTASTKDSASFLAQLGGGTEATPRPPVLHSRKSIRDGDWKLMLPGASHGFSAPKKRPRETELYNVREDLSETSNLATSQPKRVERLQKKLTSILDQEQ
ncbi:Arylsulfatase [Planctomycetes bacterium Pan216]|uniref:Arylsulfatase n=1 Tax=Kolteria novifilia TaxID=2527975 RepID=A0A518B318_9BACT|nr:Arylsulfatase [Planctomycetes bacterium Pan216]